jgi:hydroxymethylpyrimidine pyrophosphatase-like HAD family hydrolase
MNARSFSSTLMAAAKYRFILCFDFDGTLVHPQSDPVFHPGLGQMIQALRGQGAAWVINTGRSLGQTIEGMAQHGIYMEPDFIIARECDIYKPGFFSAWKDFGSWNRQALRAQEKFLKDHQVPLQDIRQLVETQTKASVITGDGGELGIVATTDEEMDGICAYIDAQARQFPDLGYHRNGIYLRFSHSGYSKGTALSELARLLGLDSSACFAAGDNFNDLSMLDPRHARMIACPGNALDPVKHIVHARGGFIATRYASEGMMEALTHYFGGAAS